VPRYLKTEVEPASETFFFNFEDGQKFKKNMEIVSSPCNIELGLRLICLLTINKMSKIKKEELWAQFLQSVLLASDSRIRCSKLNLQ
jgi:hypothetical protein